MRAPAPEWISFYEHMKRNTLLLAGLIMLGGLYTGWLTYFNGLNGSNRLDGTLGILLGLYICSKPAANMLDILLFMRADLRENIVSTNRGRIWLLFNLLTGIAAWGVIFSGVLRFVRHTP